MTNQPELSPSGHAKGIVAALFWSVVAVGGVGMMFGGEGLAYGALGAAAGLYSVYLWRGGTVVFVLLPMWLWAPIAAIGLVKKLRRRATRSPS